MIMTTHDSIRREAQKVVDQLGGQITLEAATKDIQALVDLGLRIEQAAEQVRAAHRRQQPATPSSSGPVRVADLQPEQRGLELKIRILDVGPRTIQVKGQPKEIYTGICGDNSGTTRFTAWRDFQLAPGMSLHVKNASSKRGFREGVDLQLGDYTQVQVLSVPVETTEPVRSAATTTVSKLKDVQDGARGLVIQAQVLQAEPFTVNTQNGPKDVVRGELADETARARFTAWEPSQLPTEFKPGANFLFTGLSAKAFRDTITLSINEGARLDLLPANAVKPAADSGVVAAAPSSATIAEAARSGNTSQIRAPILSVHESSGVIRRCGHEGCARSLFQGACQIHGPREGIPDLRLRAIVDDGTSSATLYAGRAIVEDLTGKTLDECLKIPPEALRATLRNATEMRYMLITGRVKEENGAFTLFAEAMEPLPATDHKAEVEELRRRLDDDA